MCQSFIPFFLLLSLFICFERESEGRRGREREREGGRERERERERERILSRVHTGSVEPSTGLELTHCEIMT